MSKQIKERKIFLEELPRRGKFIDWANSEGLQVYFIYDEIKGYIKILKYIKGHHPRLRIKYKKNEIEIGTDGLINCQIGELIKINTKDFKIEEGTRFQDDKRDITITNVKKGKDNRGHSWKYYKYYCNKCGFDCSEHWNIKDKVHKNELWIVESNLLNKNYGCACCGGVSVVVENINSIYHTDKWMIPYIGEECAKTHTHGSNDKVQVTCPDCGRVKGNRMSINHLYNRHSIGCLCKDGVKYPNKFAFNLLKQLNINFTSEYSPEWIKPKSYDFYFELNNKMYILEMDGGWHNKDNNMSGQTAEESKDIDDYKDRLAQEHGIEVIRIDCDYPDIRYRFEFIKQNITNNKKLNELFNLNKINWIKCHEYASNNLVKIACEYKRNNPKLTTTEIGELMGGYDNQIIRIWLKQGNGIWCNYDPKEEMRKSALINGKKKYRPVEIFKDNISLGIFESATYLDKHSEELFGIKLHQGCISAVCLGKQPFHKGYTFKHVSL